MELALFVEPSVSVSSKAREHIQREHIQSDSHQQWISNVHPRTSRLIQANFQFQLIS